MQWKGLGKTMKTTEKNNDGYPYSQGISRVQWGTYDKPRDLFVQVTAFAF